MLRRGLLVGALALLASFAFNVSSASAATTCSQVGGHTWCQAPSTDFPNITGPYGVVGNFSSTSPMWDFMGGQWVNMHFLDPNTPVYVAPDTGDWRWVWTPTYNWCVLHSSYLWIRWQQS
jgi:hypothetical protein